MGVSDLAVIHHTADKTDGSYELEGKPGPRWYQAVQSGRANHAVKKAVAAYEKDKGNVVAREKAAMVRMEAYHRSKGWACIGYHRVYFPSGHVYEGRPLGYLGAHTVGQNRLQGHSLMGNFEVNYPTRQALVSLDIQLEKDGVTSHHGHYYYNPTACPGKNLKKALGYK